MLSESIYRNPGSSSSFQEGLNIFDQFKCPLNLLPPFIVLCNQTTWVTVNYWLWKNVQNIIQLAGLIWRCIGFLQTLKYHSGHQTRTGWYLNCLLDGISLYVEVVIFFFTDARTAPIQLPIFSTKPKLVCIFHGVSNEERYWLVATFVCMLQLRWLRWIFVEFMNFRFYSMQ